MCRGYISKGLVYHQNSQIIGPAYQYVLNKEKSEIKAFQKGADNYSTPFVEIDPEVKKIATNSENKCIKKKFGRLTKSKDNFTVLFPFGYLYRFAESCASSTLNNPQKAREYIQYIRDYIQKFKTQLKANVQKAEPKAKQKAEYYSEFLNEQLELCNKLEKQI